MYLIIEFISIDFVDFSDEHMVSGTRRSLPGSAPCPSVPQRPESVSTPLWQAKPEEPTGNALLPPISTTFSTPW